jgi:hypothetical protein
MRRWIRPTSIASDRFLQAIGSNLTIVELPFGRIIRTSEGARGVFPLFLKTVEQSIDYVQELPRAKLHLDHWNVAFLALWEVVDFPADAARLALADAALCKALAVEGWLDELPQM